jgi:4-oxalomesaconate hydratase
VNEFRETQPAIVLTHSFLDPYNPDHPEAAQLTMKARVYAQAAGYPGAGKKLGAPPVLHVRAASTRTVRFQAADPARHHFGVRQEERCDGGDGRSAALVGILHDLAKRRGTQAVRNSGDSRIKFAEAYQRVYPQVTGEFS